MWCTLESTINSQREESKRVGKQLKEIDSKRDLFWSFLLAIWLKKKREKEVSFGGKEVAESGNKKGNWFPCVVWFSLVDERGELGHWLWSI